MIGIMLADRYRVVAQIGEGGMGKVFRGRDTMLERDVALKLLHNEFSTLEGNERFLNEAKAAAQLNHPNIVAIYDVGSYEHTPFIVMELVEGESLHDRRPVDLEEIFQIIRQVCLALEHAHRHGIVHRDLKPENVFITADETVKLMDFGLARSLASRITTDGAITGTVFYMAPELALGKDYDGRADLYALGVMLYELSTGRLPFSADDPLAVISQHLHAAPVPPKAIDASIPAALSGLIQRLLSKDPHERPANPGEVLKILEQVQVSADSIPLEDEILLLDPISHWRMVGRSQEMEILRSHWSKTMDQQGHLVLLSGEPGIGKTRLAQELIAYARTHGAVVLQGGCYEYEATSPYLPFTEALRDWVHQQKTEELMVKLGSTAVELAKLAPEIKEKIGNIEPNPPLPPDQERMRLFDNYARFLGQLADCCGLLVFVDDLHWADQGTLSLMHYLLRRLRGERLLILGAYRELELDRSHPLADALVSWNRERISERIQLSRLSLDQCHTLLNSILQKDDVDEEFANAIYNETEGNPFFIEEVLKSLIEAGQVFRQEGIWHWNEIQDLEIPQSIKDAIGRRLNRLNETSIDVLRHAAGLGKTFNFNELSISLSENGRKRQLEERILDALDEAIAAQLVRAGRDEVFTFTHDKIREVLYEGLNPIRQRRLHMRLGEGLEKLYTKNLDDHVQDLAYHFVKGGDLRKGMNYSEKAAQQAMRIYAPDEALHYYQQAADCADTLKLRQDKFRIYESLGDAQVARGYHLRAAEIYQQALALAQTPVDSSRLKVKIGTAYGGIGDERGLEYLMVLKDELHPDTQPKLLADVLTMLGRYCHYQTQHTESIEYLQRALELADPLEDLESLTSIYAYIAGAFQHLGRFEESKTWANLAITLGKVRKYPLAEAVGYEFLAEDFNLMGDWKQALDNSILDSETAQKIDSLDRFAWAGFTRGYAFYGLGDLAEAHEVALSSYRIAEDLDEHRLIVWLGAFLTFIATDMGDTVFASENGEISLARAVGLGQIALESWARYALAHLKLLENQPGLAMVICQEGMERIHGSENRIAPLYLGIITAESSLAVGDVEFAREILEDYFKLTSEINAKHYGAIAMRVNGQLFSAEGDWNKAVSCYEQALNIFDELNSRLEYARACYHLGSGFREQGDLEAAHSYLNKALTKFEACGAKLERHRTEEALKQIG